MTKRGERKNKKVLKWFFAGLLIFVVLFVNFQIFVTGGIIVGEGDEAFVLSKQDKDLQYQMDKADFEEKLEAKGLDPDRGVIGGVFYEPSTIVKGKYVKRGEFVFTITIPREEYLKDRYFWANYFPLKYNSDGSVTYRIPESDIRSAEENLRIWQAKSSEKIATPTPTPSEEPSEERDERSRTRTAPTCSSFGKSCSNVTACCSGLKCTNSKCCKSRNTHCTANSQCCSGACNRYLNNIEKFLKIKRCS